MWPLRRFADAHLTTQGISDLLPSFALDNVRKKQLDIPDLFRSSFRLFSIPIGFSCDKGRPERSGCRISFNDCPDPFRRHAFDTQQHSRPDIRSSLVCTLPVDSLESLEGDVEGVLRKAFLESGLQLDIGRP